MEDITRKLKMLPKVLDMGHLLRPKEWGQGRPERILRAAFNDPVTEDDPDAVLSRIENFCTTSSWAPIIGSDKGAILLEALATHKPRFVVELGGLVGYSAVMIARELRKLHGTDGGAASFHLYSIELDPLYAAVATKIIERAGLGGVATVLVGPAARQLEVVKGRLPNDDSKLDMAFIDHAGDCYLPDLKKMEELSMLRPGSVLVADNVVFPGAPEYVKYVRESENYKSEFHPGKILISAKDSLEDGVEVSVRTAP